MDSLSILRFLNLQEFLIVNNEEFLIVNNEEDIQFCERQERVFFCLLLPKMHHAALTDPRLFHYIISGVRKTDRESMVWPRKEFFGQGR